MRASLLFLSAVSSLVLLGACHERTTPTEQSHDPAFSIAGNRDTAGLPSHYTANGATASVNWYAGGDSSGGGYAYGYLSANRVSQVTNEWTEVNWYVYSCNGVCRYSSGYGTVPGAALSGGAGSLRLSLNPADYAGNLYVYGDSLGPINVMWRENGVYSSRSTGMSEYSYPGYTFRSNGVTESASATATGTLGEYGIPAWASASMGRNHAVTITFYR